MDPVVIIDADRCVGCFVCERACALAKCIEVSRDSRLASVVRPEDCTGCMACERACPYDCIRVIPGDVEPQERAKLVLSKVKRFMKSPPVTFRKDGNLSEVVKRMRERRVGSLVLQEGVVLIITETDVTRAWYEGVPPYSSAHVAVTCKEDCTIHEASQVMTRNGIMHLPVTSDDKLVGVLSIRDILRGISQTYLDFNSVKALVSPHESEPIRKLADFSPPTLPLRSPLRAVVREILDSRKKYVLLGSETLFTVKDVITHIAEGWGRNENVRPREGLPIMEGDRSLEEAISLMVAKNLRHVLVRDGNDLGVLSVKEVLPKSSWVSVHLNERVNPF